MNPLIQLKNVPPVFLITLVLAWFALSPAAQAQLPSPTPDGGYPGYNTAEGTDALASNTTGITNTAVGFEALGSNTTGSGNTANGFQALASNATGGDNTANGTSALVFNTTGHDNTANGALALFANTTGFSNAANGSKALSNNTTGSDNTANGAFALTFTTTGANNTATGFNALFSNSTGSGNTANGAFALQNNTTATNNTADGFQALLGNTTGARNTAVGESAFKGNTTADNNTGLGFQVAFHNTTGASNTVIGYHALLNNTTGSSNIALGLNAGGNLTTGSNNIDIGSLGGGGESNTIRIGSAQTRTFIKGISGAVVTGAAVVVNAAGQLGVTPSSARFKNHIKPMDTASEVILALRPVSFYYDQDIDPQGLTQFGLVAEEVDKVNPSLVVRDKEGKPYTVRYDAVNAMLLNEFLKEHNAFVEEQRKVQEQEATIAQLRQDSAEQRKQIEALTAGLQKVSAQIEMSTTPNVVLNNR